MTYHQTTRYSTSERETYSAIEHFARIEALSSYDWRTVRMVMLTSAIDCSQDKSKQHFVMAGFVSDAARWMEFDVEWRRRLAQDGLTYFHMHKFAHSIGPFDGWRHNESRRRALLGDLLGIVSSHAWQKFGCVLPLNSFRMFSDESRKDFVPTMIATAGRLIWGDIEVWRKRERFQQPARMIFEDGDEEKGSLIEAIKEVTGRAPSFEPKKDIPERNILAFTALQAADILAYEAQKLTQQFDQRVAEVSLRFPYHELEKIHGDIKVLRGDGVKMMEGLFAVERHFNKVPLPTGPVQ